MRKVEDIHFVVCEIKLFSPQQIHSRKSKQSVDGQQRKTESKIEKMRCCPIKRHTKQRRQHCHKRHCAVANAEFCPQPKEEKSQQWSVGVRCNRVQNVNNRVVFHRREEQDE